jgi:protein involved in polysaccharide export with SLBB domain
LALLLLPTLLGSAQDGTVVAGDTVRVVTQGFEQYTGDFLVGSDGKFTVPVFGEFAASGRTLREIERDVRARARLYLRDPSVTVTLLTMARRFVYLVSENMREGPVEWKDGMDVRQLVASHTNLAALDAYEVRLYRGGDLVRTIDLVKLMRDGSESENVAVVPGDVVTMLPVASKTVSVFGMVLRAGDVRIRPEQGAAAAIAAAGGLARSEFIAEEVRVSVRRGTGVTAHTLADLADGGDIALEPGDVVTVSPPALVTVTVGGEVTQPRSLVLREGASLAQAIESAGGATPLGTLGRVLLFRGGQVEVIDATGLVGGGTDPGPTIAEGDFVFVPPNRRDFHVFGFVNEPGLKLMPDARAVRLTDALAAAGGLNAKGTTVRVFLLRPGPDGKFVAKTYDLDAFIKRGQAGMNPEIQPGDVVFFDQSKGTTLADVLRAIPSLLLVDRLFE